MISYQQHSLDSDLITLLPQLFSTLCIYRMYIQHLIKENILEPFLLIFRKHLIVDHYLLLDKLYSIGLSQRSLLWFNAYLHGRRQYVALQNTRSTSLVIGKGVPQGSVLGPLLFSVYINDMPSICLSFNVHLYADDTVLYTSYNQKDQVRNALQSDFIIVQNWLREHNLLLNEKKNLH